MKRTLALILVLLLLTGCSLSQKEYQVKKPHIEADPTALPAAIEVSSYDQLVDALLQFISAGRETGSIRTVEYGGNVEEDLVLAVHETTRENPVGAFAVDYLNHTCVKIVNYYEIKVNITYRKAIYEIEELVTIEKEDQIRSHVEWALQNFRGRIAMQMPESYTYDIKALISHFYMENPEYLVEIPQIMVMVYPEKGPERVVEVEFQYTHTTEELQQMKGDIEESVSAAAEYIRYRDTDRDKVTLLYTYLSERFGYRTAETTTPVYSALCSGVADPMGLACGFAMICKTAGVECHVVEGLLGGKAHFWNIVSDDGDFRHVDLSKSMDPEGTFRLMTDWEMSEYYWDTEQYPICVAIEEPTEDPQEEPTEEPEDPTEEPSEEPPEEGNVEEETE